MLQARPETVESRRTGALERFSIEKTATAAADVLELDLAEMLLDDLLDDGETEPGALGARRHIGLGQAFPFFGQPDARVEHVDHHLLAISPQTDLDAVSGEVRLTFGSDELVRGVSFLVALGCASVLAPPVAAQSGSPLIEAAKHDDVAGVRALLSRKARAANRRELRSLRSAIGCWCGPSTVSASLAV